MNKLYLLLAAWLLVGLPTTARADPAPTPNDTTETPCQTYMVLMALNAPDAHLQRWGLEQALDLARWRHDTALTTRIFDAVVRLYEQSVDDRRMLALATLLSFDADEARAYVHGHATESEQQEARDRWLKELNGQ